MPGDEKEKNEKEKKTLIKEAEEEFGLVPPPDMPEPPPSPEPKEEPKEDK